MSNSPLIGAMIAGMFVTGITVHCVDNQSKDQEISRIAQVNDSQIKQIKDDNDTESKRLSEANTFENNAYTEALDSVGVTNSQFMTALHRWTVNLQTSKQMGIYHGDAVQ
jgi:folate-dependent phosphoribosylglycinamide formyltransferase PurN